MFISISTTLTGSPEHACIVKDHWVEPSPSCAREECDVSVTGTRTPTCRFPVEFAPLAAPALGLLITDIGQPPLGEVLSPVGARGARISDEQDRLL
jgi:hypothetical protein